MDPIDELLKLATPDRLLRDARATGEGVAVCIIDSGIERDLLIEKHPDMKPIEGGIFTRESLSPLPYEGKHSTPHGTTVADIVLSIAPQVKLYSADVFGLLGSCEIDMVLKAIDHALDVWKVKVINLSLGVVEQRLRDWPRRQQFQRAIEEAYFRDVLVIAAAHNDHPITRSYPALFAPPLVSVDKGLFGDPMEFAYRLRDQVEFQAHGRGYLGPFSQEPATSWAAPHLTGIVARLLTLRPTLKPFEVKTLLYWLGKTV